MKKPCWLLVAFSSLRLAFVINMLAFNTLRLTFGQITVFFLLAFVVSSTLRLALELFFEFSYIGGIVFFFFFARIGRSDLTKKLEKVGPFECDELEKHCRVSAKCYPTRVPALYTMTKEKFKSGFRLLLLVFRQTKSHFLNVSVFIFSENLE